MALDRISSGRTDHGKHTAEFLTREKLKFVLANLTALEQVRYGDKKVKLAIGFDQRLKDGEGLLDWMYRAIDDLYEYTMKGLGLPSIGTHRDKPRCNLRHPKNG